jgi:Domain of unknown function (DUF4258)
MLSLSLWVGTEQEFMALIDEIRSKAGRGLFELSRHAADQMILRQIQIREVRQVFANSQIIEDYPEDKYGPSCLLLGFTETRRPLHIQCSYPSRPVLKVVTLYEPDPSLWIDFRTRRK